MITWTIRCLITTKRPMNHCDRAMSFNTRLQFLPRAMLVDRRVTTVLSTDPNRNPILVLQNGDVLPPDTSVKTSPSVGIWEHCIRTSMVTFGPFLPFSWKTGNGASRGWICDKKESESMTLCNEIWKNLPQSNNKRDLRPWICFTSDENNRKLQVLVVATTTVANGNVHYHRNKSEHVMIDDL